MGMSLGIARWHKNSGTDSYHTGDRQRWWQNLPTTGLERTAARLPH
jgi:hypothetical protein